MAKTKKKEVSEELKHLKEKLQKKEKVIIGTDRVLKELKAKEISKVFLASNCPQKIKQDVLYYAELAEISVIELEMDNEELGVFCKKNFFVAVIGIRD